MNYYISYKGIYYKYLPKIEGTPYWELSDRQDRVGNVYRFAATKYRIDQCLEIFKNELESNKTRN